MVCLILNVLAQAKSDPIHDCRGQSARKDLTSSATRTNIGRLKTRGRWEGQPKPPWRSTHPLQFLSPLSFGVSHEFAYRSYQKFRHVVKTFAHAGTFTSTPLKLSRDGRDNIGSLKAKIGTAERQCWSFDRNLWGYLGEGKARVHFDRELITSHRWTRSHKGGFLAFFGSSPQFLRPRLIPSLTVSDGGEAIQAITALDPSRVIQGLSSDSK